MAKSGLRLGSSWRIRKVPPIHAGEKCHCSLSADCVDSRHGGHGRALRTITTDGAGIHEARRCLSVSSDCQRRTWPGRRQPRRDRVGTKQSLRLCETSSGTTVIPPSVQKDQHYIYAKGGHGFGVRKSILACSRWTERCLAWLKVQCR